MNAAPSSWDRERDREATGERGPVRLPGVFVWLALVGLAWFEAGRETLAATLGDAASPRTVALAAIGGVAGRLVTELIEAGFYVALWRAAGRSLSFGTLFVTIASLSLLDVIALQLAQWGGDTAPAWLAFLCGFHVLPGVLASQPGLRVALGGIGLLALARVAATAWAQKPAGARARTRLALTAAVWLAGRLATWWTTDLVRGVSPLP